MIDNAIIVMMAMQTISLCVLGGQFIVGDAFNISITNFEGEPIESHLLALFDEERLNTVSENIITGNFTGNTTYYDPIETFTTGAAFVAWEVVLLLSGTYIFNFLYLMGVPLYFVVVMVLIYASYLLGRTIVGLVRGV